MKPDVPPYRRFPDVKQAYIPTDQVWLGHNKAKLRKRRNVQKDEKENVPELSGICYNKQCYN